MSVMILFVLVLDIALCYGQNASSVWPKERGLIIPVFHDSGDTSAAQLRHIPIFPGFESFRGSIPGLRFQNSKIQFLSADVDFRAKSAYFYDYHLRSIVLCTGYNAALNSTFMNFSFLHVGVSRGTVQIAVDWLSHTIYWSDSVYRWIMAAPGQKEKIEKDYYKIIADEHLEAPDGLTVDPIQGYLFWSDNGKYPKIERADSMGNNRHTIITQNLVSPLSLEADIVDKRIYWLDSYTESILTARYDGSDVKMVTRIPKATLLDLAIFRDVIYVVDIKNGDVATLNKTNGMTEATVLNIKPETVYGVAVYGEETQPVTNNIDVCGSLRCEHLCITINATSAQCTCADGYTLNATTGNCTETYRSAHKAVLYANTTHICSADIRSLAYLGHEIVCLFSVNRTTNTTNTAQSPTYQGFRGVIKMFDLDMEDRIMYVVTTDNKIFSRSIDLPIDNDAIDILVTASGNVSGVAFDAEDGGNLYWCESDTGNIYVVNVNNKAARKVNPDVFISNPKNLLILQTQRKLAWMAGSGTSLSIQTMNLDGSDRRNVVSGLSEIVSLIFDREQKAFYYMSPSRQLAYSMSLYNSSVPLPLKVSIDTTATILVLYNNYLTWVFTPSDKTYQHLIRTYDFTVNRAIALGFFDNISNPVDIKILDVKLQQKDTISPCAHSTTHECDHICITKYIDGTMQPVCECKLGYTPSNDGRRCYSNIVEDNFIFVTDWTHNALQQIDLNTSNINAFPLNQSGSYMGVLYDSTNKKLLWTLSQDTRIYSANLNGTDKKLYAEIGTGGYPYRMSKDLTTGNLYYTGYYGSRSHVGFVTPAGKVFQINVDYRYSEFGDVIVHPQKGWVYFTVYGPPSYIGRCDMDGKNCIQLINGSNIGYPDGLAIDYNNGYLYWSDATRDTIQKCDLEGKNCITIVSVPTYNSEQIRDISTDGQFLYYLAYKKDHVVRVTLSQPNITSIVGQSTGLGKLDTMSFYSSSNPNKQPVSSFCKDRGGLGDCSTVCVPTPNGRTCMCEDGIALNPDGRTCSNVYRCPDLIRQQDNPNIQITFNSTCLRYIGETCRYSCPLGYIPTGSGQLKCLNIGWDNQTLSLCEVEQCSSVIAHGSLDTQCSRRVGINCTFSCDKFYSSSISTITCQKSGWNVDTNSLCQEMQCGNSSFQNGQLSTTCDKLIGRECSYTCNSGYVKTVETVICKDDGMWYPTGACQIYQCSATIRQQSNEVIIVTVNATCTRYVGITCPYSCPSGYSPVGSGLLKCLNTGWDNDTATLCKAQIKLCPAHIANGKLDDTCTRRIGDVCNFTCNEGFVKTEQTTFCTAEGTYHKETADYCAPFVCSPNIAHGALDMSCSREIGAVCNFSCDSNFQNTTSTITCGSSGWNVDTSQLCKERLCANDSLENGVLSASCNKKVGETCGYFCSAGYINTTAKVICGVDWTWLPLTACQKSGSSSIPPEAQKGQSSEGVSKAGLIAGIVVLVIVVIALAVVIVFLVRRYLGNVPSLKASFHHSGREIAMENPGYLESDMQPVSDGHGTIGDGRSSASADPGMVNPLYGRESLRSEGQLDLNNDQAVLTKESWTKEKEQKEREYVRFQ